jgi:dTDP-4-dehydrorhamnose 3,5-epimerase
MWIPPGFAHGFLVLSEFADFDYKTTGYYEPQSDRSLNWADPAIGIEWPQLDGSLGLSAKDQAAPLLRDAETERM